VLPCLATWLRGNQAQRRTLPTMLPHLVCILSLSMLYASPGLDFVLLHVIQLLSSVLEYVGAVYARNHEFLSNNSSLAAQPLTLMVPGSCLNEQAVLVVSGACSIHTFTARVACTPTTCFLHIQHGRRELSKQDSSFKRTQLCL
jgi:predicted exporter